jgi:hypothetical protein
MHTAQGCGLTRRSIIAISLFGGRIEAWIPYRAGKSIEHAGPGLHLHVQPVPWLQVDPAQIERALPGPDFTQLYEPLPVGRSTAFLFP